MQGKAKLVEQWRHHFYMFGSQSAISLLSSTPHTILLNRVNPSFAIEGLWAEPVVVEKLGRPAVVMLAHEEYQRLKAFDVRANAHLKRSEGLT